MSTHPLWRPFEEMSDEQIAAARVPGASPAEAPVVVAPDASWPDRFAVLRDRIRAALGERALRIEHVGSTSVPGLWAKPLIDLDLVVPDNTDEASYVPALEAAGCELRVREPEWFEHRCLRSHASPGPAGNVHVWSPGGTQELERHVAFRDWLRTHAEDREAYAALKRDLAGQGFTDTMHYNNAKAGPIYDIYERIFAADATRPHDPQPRG